VLLRHDPSLKQHHPALAASRHPHKKAPGSISSNPDGAHPLPTLLLLSPTNRLSMPHLVAGSPTQAEPVNTAPPRYEHFPVGTQGNPQVQPRRTNLQTNCIQPVPPMIKYLQIRRKFFRTLSRLGNFALQNKHSTVRSHRNIIAHLPVIRIFVRIGSSVSFTCSLKIVFSAEFFVVLLSFLLVPGTCDTSPE